MKSKAVARPCQKNLKQVKHTSVKDVIKRLDVYSSMSDALPPNLVSSVRHSHSLSSSSVFVAARTITLRHFIYIYRSVIKWVWKDKDTWLQVTLWVVRAPTNGTESFSWCSSSVIPSGNWAIWKYKNQSTWRETIYANNNV